MSTYTQVMAHGIMNVPALFIVLVLSLLLIRGIRESAAATAPAR